MNRRWRKGIPVRAGNLWSCLVSENSVPSSHLMQAHCFDYQKKFIKVLSINGALAKKGSWHVGLAWSPTCADLEGLWNVHTVATPEPTSCALLLDGSGGRFTGWTHGHCNILFTSKSKTTSIGPALPSSVSMLSALSQLSWANWYSIIKLLHVQTPGHFPRAAISTRCLHH